MLESEDENFSCCVEKLVSIKATPTKRGAVFGKSLILNLIGFEIKVSRLFDANR